MTIGVGNPVVLGPKSRGMSAASFGGSAVPQTISGLYLWVKADAITGKSDSDTVTQWDDSSGNGRHLTEATNPPTYQTNELNGLPVVRFDGNNDKLSRTVTNFASTWTIAVAARKQTAVGGIEHPLFQIADTSGHLMTYNVIGNGFTWVHDNVGVNAGLGLCHPVTTAFFIVARLNSNSSMDFDGNGTRVNINPHDNAASPNIFNLGAGAFGVFGDYDVAEAMIYSRPISDAEINKLEAYVTAKWGITIA